MRFEQTQHVGSCLEQLSGRRPRNLGSSYSLYHITSLTYIGVDTSRKCTYYFIMYSVQLGLDIIMLSKTAHMVNVYTFECVCGGGDVVMVSLGNYMYFYSLDVYLNRHWSIVIAQTIVNSR